MGPEHAFRMKVWRPPAPPVTDSQLWLLCGRSALDSDVIIKHFGDVAHSEIMFYMSSLSRMNNGCCFYYTAFTQHLKG